MKNKYISFLLVSFFILLVSVELVSRYYGLNQLPLFEESTDYEYIHKPNQDTYIYGNHFITNEFSMRSQPIYKNDTLVVLLVGDSVINGGNTVSHDNLASTSVETKIKNKLRRNIRVLNISSYSWGPSNIVAYIKKFGTFNADLILYVCNSGDAYDYMTFNKIVGVNNMFPEKNEKFATLKLIEKINNWIIGKFKRSLNENTKIANYKQLNLDKGFSNIDSIARSLNIPLIVYLHPNVNEIAQKSYSSDGVEIMNFFKNKHRIVIKGLALGAHKKQYRDEIHLNNEGQKFLSDALYTPICQFFK